MNNYCCEENSFNSILQQYAFMKRVNNPDQVSQLLKLNRILPYYDTTISGENSALIPSFNCCPIPHQRPLHFFNFLTQHFESQINILKEDPKPSHSYIGLIAMSILKSPEKRLVLSDIYKWILENYPYFKTKGPGWRNSIRHNLSLNDCFIKDGRSANGKGHYWTIHPANLEDFEKGDFRRRRAQRRVRRSLETVIDKTAVFHDDNNKKVEAIYPPKLTLTKNENDNAFSDELSNAGICTPSINTLTGDKESHTSRKKKCCFDMESILAPDKRSIKK